MHSKQLHGGHWTLFRPTNGAFTLFLALHTCDIVRKYNFFLQVDCLNLARMRSVAAASHPFGILLQASFVNVPLSGFQVDAYGFITAHHSKYHNYYYEKFARTRVVFYINHDYNLEIKTWKKLHDANIIRLYQREEDKQKNGDKQ